MYVIFLYYLKTIINFINRNYVKTYTSNFKKNSQYQYVFLHKNKLNSSLRKSRTLCIIKKLFLIDATLFLENDANSYKFSHIEMFFNS